MHQRSNHPVRFFATAKTHKFEFIGDISLESLNLHPIIDQTGTYIYNASKVIAKYLSPLSKNEFSISDTLSFPELLKKVVIMNLMKMFPRALKVCLQVFLSKKR